MNEYTMKVSPLSQGLNSGEVVICAVTNKSYLFLNNELILIKPEEDKLSLIPQWLIDDIDNLRLTDVRLSCAIYELYEYYANVIRLELTINENSDWLDLVNERLDWIDKNTDLLNFAINRSWKR